jgi:rod shape-determining protein MreB and related proteins
MKPTTETEIMSKAKTGSHSSDRLMLGIDLGTSRSVVCASNGERAWIDSYVGYPKDFVARKVLGAPVLFGEAALANRQSLDLYRPLEHGVIREGSSRNEQAIQDLARHLISLVNPADGQPVSAAVGVPAESFKNNKLAIKRCVGDAADALLVVSEPFAVAYGQNLLKDALIIDIGGGTIDFCIMHGAVPGDDDQRTLATAGDYIDAKLLEGIQERYPKSSVTLNMARRFKEQFSFVGDLDGKVEVDIPVEGKATKHDITSEMRAACESVLPSVVETAAEIISRSDPDYQDVVRRNIYLAGGGSQVRGLADYLQRELGAFGSCRVKIVEDVLYAGAEGCLALATDMPAEYWKDVAN